MSTICKIYMGWFKSSDIHDVSCAEQAAVYVPLQDHPPCREISHSKLKLIAAICGCTIFVLSLVAVIIHLQSQWPFQNIRLQNDDDSSVFAAKTASISNISIPVIARGVAEGVSAKSYPSVSSVMSYNWTNAMFSWQRTAFHFQPEKNWMNDPNGPLFYKGWYHLFYQYNPDSALWGNISWGHAISTDLIHWLYLPIAMLPDKWYDLNGVWSGSATLLPDGNILMLYTGDTDRHVQVQNLAYPANLSDPLLLDWIKYPGNPVIIPPPTVEKKDFRDPTTAWLGPDGKWRVTIGSRQNKTGLSFVYTTSNFTKFELQDNLLHAVPGTGMWECIDFYPVSEYGSNGLDTSVNGPGTKHILKASLEDTGVDYYSIGTYYPQNDTWVPDNPDEDVGVGLKLDYGRYYASKTFFDQDKHRRILWGWINETDTEGDDLAKGWASVQTIPRTVVYDTKTKANVLQWPVEEIESLRLKGTEFDGVTVEAGTVVPLHVGPATQLDILADFEIENLVGDSKVIEKDSTGCGDGAMDRSAFGPFGIVVIADDTLSELTPVYFRPSDTMSCGNADNFFCTDTKRSSEAPGVSKVVYGSKIPVLNDEKLSMRVLVDHSIIESFGQGGRTVITARVYPTKAIYGAARVFLFNNATNINVKANIKFWELNSAFIRPFPFQETLHSDL